MKMILLLVYKITLHLFLRTTPATEKFTFWMWILEWKGDQKVMFHSGRNCLFN